MGKETRYAVLIDADNVAAKYTKYILDEVSNYGVVTYKRVYGDWTRPNLAGWKSMALDNAVTPIQQYNYTTGKNATDSAMIIDAMDILPATLSSIWKYLRMKNCRVRVRAKSLN